MTSVIAQPIDIPLPRSRSWLMSIWLHPRPTFKQIVVQTKSVWLIPLLLFSIAVLGNVIANGHLKQLATQSGEVILPPDFQYYSPEQQQQLMTAIQATSSPAFLYILPVLGRMGTVWIIWLITGSLLHLIMTLSGGRGNTSRALDIVAWASVPLILREFIRAVAITIAKEPIQYPGLSGFAPVGMTEVNLLITEMLSLVDIYAIWFVVLLAIGVQSCGELNGQKSWFVVATTICILILLALMFGLAQAKLGQLQITRPFFF